MPVIRRKRNKRKRKISKRSELNIYIKKPKFRNPFKFLARIFPKEDMASHILTSFSLLPLFIALWIAFPTFQIDIGDNTYKFSGLQTSQTTNPYTGIETGNVRFANGLELQNGVSLVFKIQKEDQNSTSEKTNTDKAETSNLNTNETNDTESQDVEKTIEILRTRLSYLSPIESRIERLYSDDNEDRLLVNMAGSREEVEMIPYLLTFKGNISFWIDDPNYVKTQDTENPTSNNPIEGRMLSDLTRDDIMYAETINSQATNGLGIKVTFKQSAQDKLSKAANLVGSNGGIYGLMIMIDNQPVIEQAFVIDAQGKLISFGINPTNSVVYFHSYQANLLDYEAITSIINTEILPKSVSVESNMNIQKMINVDLSLMKVSMFIAFILIHIILFVLYKWRSILNFIVNLNTLVISVAIMQLLQQVFTLSLIFGVMLGLIILIIFGIYSNNLLNDRLDTKEEFKQTSTKARKIYRNMAFFLLSFAILITGINVLFSLELAFGIGVVMMVGLISHWTVFRTFVNEIYILPLKYK